MKKGKNVKRYGKDKYKVLKERANDLHRIRQLQTTEKVQLAEQRRKIREKNRKKYQSHKKAVDPEGLTLFYHAWTQGTSNCRGVALISKAEYAFHGRIKLIEVLEGNIPMLTERGRTFAVGVGGEYEYKKLLYRQRREDISDRIVKE